MATDEQKAASKKVMDAVIALNKALDTAGAECLFVELQAFNEIGGRNCRYTVAKIETRETVLP
jgi:hypothetical protein